MTFEYPKRDVAMKDPALTFSFGREFPSYLDALLGTSGEFSSHLLPRDVKLTWSTFKCKLMKRLIASGYQFLMVQVSQKSFVLIHASKGFMISANQWAVIGLIVKDQARKSNLKGVVQNPNHPYKFTLTI